MDKSFRKYQIIFKQKEVEETYIFRLKPQEDLIPHFFPGQYCFLKNPQFENPDEAHPFSIASSPETTYLEFCIKEMGDWTENFCEKTRVGDTIFVSNPQGNFVWDSTIQNAVF